MTKSKSKGFSLIELMIVVAIIAILAAIAIPNFMRFAMKSKTAEATTNLGAIRTAQEAYRSENDVYLECASVGGGADATPVVWLGDIPGFDIIGWAPDGRVRYLYDVDVTAAAVNPPAYMASAVGDLDEDTLTCVFGIHRSDPEFPKIQKNSVVVLVPPWTAGNADDF